MKVVFGPFFLCEVVCGQGVLSGFRRGGRKFGRLGMQVHPDENLVRDIFEGSFTERLTGSGKSISEVGFKF